MLVVKRCNGGLVRTEVDIAACVEEPEACRLALRLILEREKDDVKLDSIPIVRDFGRRGVGLS